VAAPTAAVKFTANFESNLASIETFWQEQDAPQAFAKLLDDLGQTVIGNLEQHPRLGRRFLARSPQSLEVQHRVTRLQQRLGSIDLREYLAGDYLMLYGVDGGMGGTGLPASVYLLAIRHHRQLSFDFDGFWQVNRGGKG
jgi:hypothetical protein